MILAEVAWPILERIRLPGGLEISPHGISVALGFLLGAQMLLRRAQRRGVSRRPGLLPPGRETAAIEQIMQALVTRAAIGGILGARIFYVATRLDQFPDPASWVRVWEGGLSLFGGIAGALLLALPYAMRRKLDPVLILDSMAPGLAFGLFIGRIGDLIIGEHLGGRTDFFLGWRCTNNIGIGPPEPFTGPQVQGCFDAVVHQTALYDFLAAGILCALLLWLERSPRFDGFFTAVFGAGYGAFRFVSDFAREADRDLVGTLTGTQVSSIVVILGVLGWLLIVHPERRTPWAWNPPDFEHPWDAQPDEPEDDPEADEEPSAVRQTGPVEAADPSDAAPA